MICVSLIRAKVEVHHERRTPAINRIKLEIYHWQGKMEQQGWDSHCFLSQPQLCAHTLIAHCHLSLSQALASSPTVPTMPGRHMPLTNIHLLPTGLRHIWSGPANETCLDIIAQNGFTHRWIHAIWSGTHTQTHVDTHTRACTHKADN